MPECLWHRLRAAILGHATRVKHSGFYADARREHRQAFANKKPSLILITPQLIPALGSSQGTYEFVDTNTVPGATYSYWLVEVDTQGLMQEYGPVTIKIDPIRWERAE